MFRFIVASVVLVASGLVDAADFAAGHRAYESGDYEDAIAVWQPLAESGDADAAYFLGQMYFIGRGVPQNYGEATRWLRAAARAGHPSARVVLSEAYLPGRAAPTDGAAAAEFYRRLAGAGDVVAQFMLARMLERQQGGMDEAVRWLRLAAEKDFAPAQLRLAQLYDSGHGVPTDAESALTWIHKAAALGDAHAALALGLAYEEGKGVERDPVRAYAWIRRAAAGGSQQASGELSRLAGSIDVEQRQAGTELASELVREVSYRPFEWRDGVYLSGLGPISVPDFDPDFPPPPSAGLNSGASIGISLELLIQSDGRVAEVNLLQGDGSDAARSFANSLRQARFIPAQLDGEPVAVLMTYILQSVGQR